MSRVYLEKAGFIRSEVDDFSDDGTKFYCYRTPNGRVRVEKATRCGNIYIKGRINGNLDYEEFQSLPHYKCMNNLNGIDQGIITQQDVIGFYNDCIEYEKEYSEAESKIVWPTVEEIAARRRQVINKRICEYAEITEKCTVEKLLSLDDYKLKWFKNAYTSLKLQASPTGTDEEFAKNNYKTYYSRGYVKNDYDLRDSYNYEECKEYLK